jgi:hypothetical protein
MKIYVTITDGEDGDEIRVFTSVQNAVKYCSKAVANFPLVLPEDLHAELWGEGIRFDLLETEIDSHDAPQRYVGPDYEALELVSRESPLFDDSDAPPDDSRKIKGGGLFDGPEGA